MLIPGIVAEQELVVLMSIWDLGGSGARRNVLNNIARRGYYRMVESDLETRSNGDEVWRNELSFARKRLEQEGLIDGRLRNNWELTDSGKAFLRSLCNDALRANRFRKLTEAGRIRAAEIARALECEEDVISFASNLDAGPRRPSR